MIAPSSRLARQRDQRDDLQGEAGIVPARTLIPEASDRAADALIDNHDAQPFLDLLATLARTDAPAARSAEQLAEMLAHSARIVRSAVQERVSQLRADGLNNDPLMLVRKVVDSASIPAKNHRRLIEGACLFPPIPRSQFARSTDSLVVTSN